MKLFTLLLFFISSLFIVHAQELIPVSLKSSLVRVNLIDPSAGIEFALNENQTIDLSAGLVCRHDDYEVDSPHARVAFRNYYSRKNVKKELRSNSGNFFGLQTGIIFDALKQDTEEENPEVPNPNEKNIKYDKSYFLGPVWGFQRNYRSGLHIGLTLGMGAFVGENRAFDTDMIAEFELGFVFGGK